MSSFDPFLGLHSKLADELDPHTVQVLMIQYKLDYLHSCLCAVGIRLVQVGASNDIVGVNDPRVNLLISKRFTIDGFLEDLSRLIRYIELWGCQLVFHPVLDLHPLFRHILSCQHGGSCEGFPWQSGLVIGRPVSSGPELGS